MAKKQKEEEKSETVVTESGSVEKEDKPEAKSESNAPSSIQTVESIQGKSRQRIDPQYSTNRGLGYNP